MAAATDNTPKEIYWGLKKFKGSINELAKRCDRSREWVRLVLSGKYDDVGLLQEAALLWSEHEQKLATSQNQIEQTISEAKAALN